VVHDQVCDKLDFSFEDMGARKAVAANDNDRDDQKITRRLPAPCAPLPQRPDAASIVPLSSIPIRRLPAAISAYVTLSAAIMRPPCRISRRRSASALAACCWSSGIFPKAGRH